MQEFLEQVDNRRDIAAILRRLATEGAELEVRMTGATGYVLDQVFYSLIRDDQKPRREEDLALIEERREEDPTREVELRPAWSYLGNHDTLLLEPLVPSLGNLKIRLNPEVELQGVNGQNIYRFFAGYQEVELIQGNPALRLSFPRTMEISRGRRHFRADLKDLPLPLSLEVTHPALGSARLQLSDLSAGGLSFICEWPAEELARGVELRFSLSSSQGDFEAIELSGYLRNLVPVAQRRRGREKQAPLLRCGVQLVLASEAVSLKVEKTAAMIQRFALQMRQALLDGDTTEMQQLLKRRSAG